VSRARSSRIGVDARMVSHEKATLLSSKLNALESKLVYLPQNLVDLNLVDLTWKVKPIKPDAAIYIRHFEFAGRDALSQSSTISSSIRTSGNPSNLFVLHP